MEMRVSQSLYVRQDIKYFPFVSRLCNALHRMFTSYSSRGHKCISKCYSANTAFVLFFLGEKNLKFMALESFHAAFALSTEHCAQQQQYWIFLQHRIFMCIDIQVIERMQHILWEYEHSEQEVESLVSNLFNFSFNCKRSRAF